MTIPFIYAPAEQELHFQRCFFHVTTRYRADLIVAKGIDPKKSKGKQQCSWLVGMPRLAWAIAHVSIRHDVKVNDLRVVQLWLDPAGLNLFVIPNVYRAFKDIFIHPSGVISARKALRMYDEFMSVPF